MKQSADDNFELDVNNRKFSKLVENTVGKGEIACYKQFLLFPQCFQKVCFPGASKGVIVWEWVNCNYCMVFNPLPNDKSLDVTKVKAFADNKLRVAKMTISLFDRIENTVGKGENAGYQHFLLFPQCFPKSSSLGLLKVRIVL